MSQEAEQAAPTNPTWTIASDAKTVEYTAQIDATGDRLQHIAAAVTGILLLLLFLFILPATSPKIAAKMSDLRKQEVDLEEEGKKLESKKDERVKTVELRKEVGVSNTSSKTARKPPQPVKNTKSAEKKNNHEKSDSVNKEKLAASNRILLNLEEEVSTEIENPLPDRLNELRRLRDKVEAELETLQKLEGKDGIEEASLKEAMAQANAIHTSVKLEITKFRATNNKEKLAASKKALLKLEEDISAESEKPAPDKLNELRKLRDKVETELGTLQKLEGKEGIENASFASAVAQATKTLTSVKFEIVKLRKEAISSRKVPLDFLGLLGISYGGLTETTLPVLYLPILWSLLLLGFLLFWTISRFSMLNLYSRLFRRSLRIHEGLSPPSDRLKAFLDDNAEELLGAPQCKWWWLAPLPRFDGKFLRHEEFRAALGWTKVHRVKVFQVTVAAFLVVLLQVIVLYSGLTIIGFSEDVGKAWILRGVEFSLAFGNISLIFLALLSLDQVPDFGSNQEQVTTLNRRTFLHLAVLGIVLSPFAYQVFVNKYSRGSRQTGKGQADPACDPGAGNLRLKLLPRPRFRRHKPQRFIEAIGLKQGFYLNPYSHIVHYLARKVNKPIDPTVAMPYKKGRREPFKTRAERTHYRALVAKWRFLGKGLEARPPRELRKKVNEDCTPRQTPAPITPKNNLETSLVFRDAGALKQDRLIPLSMDIVLGELKPRKLIAVGFLRKGKSGKNLPIEQLNSKRFVFSVQEAVLQILHESPENIDYACEFLFAAIEARGPTTDTLCLFDLLAALSYRHQKMEWFEKVLRKTDEYGNTENRLAEFAMRAKRWKNSEGKWQKRWKPIDPNSGIKGRNKWASLPM